MIVRVNVVLNRTQVLLTLKMTTAQVVETSVTVHNNSPIQDYVHPDDQIQPTSIQYCFVRAIRVSFNASYLVGSLLL